MLSTWRLTTLGAAVTGCVLLAAGSATSANADPAPAPVAAGTNPEFTLLPPDTSAAALTDHAAEAIQQALAEKYPQGFGGLWVEHGSSDLIHVSLTPSASSAEVAAYIHSLALPTQPVIAFSGARNSRASLTRAYDALSARIVRKNDTVGKAAWALSINEQENRLDASVHTNSPGDIAQSLRAAAGVDVAVTRATAKDQTSDNDRGTSYNHLRAGQLINNAAGGGCSAGFSVQSTHNYNYYVITAGHCYTTAGDAWFEGTNNNPLIGTAGTNTLRYGPHDCDCMAIGPLDAGVATNVVYVTPTTGVAMTSDCSETCLPVGASICLSGAGDLNQGSKCGQLKTRSMTCGVTGVTTTNLAGASYSRLGGDSGGAIFTSSGQAVGIHSGDGGNCSGSVSGVTASFSWENRVINDIAVATLHTTP